MLQLGVKRVTRRARIFSAPIVSRKKDPCQFLNIQRELHASTHSSLLDQIQVLFRSKKGTLHALFIELVQVRVESSEVLAIRAVVRISRIRPNINHSESSKCQKPSLLITAHDQNRTNRRY